MFYFTKYAEQKFDILNKHKVYFTREQIEDTVAAPDKAGKKGKLLTAQKENVKVIYKKEEGVLKIITFFPIK
jgi:predicted PolB exonuclease-like 3'-5' exonuclease